LLRCFSWWQHDQNKNSTVLHSKVYITSNGRTDSIHDMYKAMHEVFGVRLDIEKRANTDSPEVHVDAPWRAMDVQTKTYAMVSPDHAKTLVEGLLNHYTPNNDKRAGCPADGKSKKSKPVIAFLDRKDSKRSIANGPEVLDKLRQSGHDVRYQPSFHGMSLIEQIKFMSEADIVMGPHGTQFTTSLFMPWCGSLLEFFPRQYYAPNWYGSMVALSGKHHFLTYQGGQALNAYRRNTRHFNASVEAVEQVTAVMVERWHSCCAARNTNNCNSNKFGICTIVEEKRGGKMSIPPEAIDGTEQNPYVAETRYNGTLPAWEMFLGPGRPYFPEGQRALNKSDARLLFPNHNSTEAVCRLSNIFLFQMFPHNFQQLVRCFSWWQMDHNKNKTPVLYIQQYDHGTDDMASVHGMYKAMQDAFGVRLDIGNRTNEDSPEVHVMAPWETMATQTGIHAMASREHAKRMAEGFLNYYTPNNDKRAGCPTNGSSKKGPVIAFLDRQDSRRSIANSNEVLYRLQKAGYDVLYQSSFKGMSLMGQMKFMSEVDIVMGPHGQQFLTSMFMPQCGSLFEFFPRNYYAPNWYGSLVALFGKNHFFAYNGGGVSQWMNESRETKSYNASADTVMQVTEAMVERWHSCCSALGNV
ncbi:unknown protein (Partial), partial [Seminavis robusta]